MYKVVTEYISGKSNVVDNLGIKIATCDHEEDALRIARALKMLDTLEEVLDTHRSNSRSNN